MVFFINNCLRAAGSGGKKYLLHAIRFISVFFSSLCSACVQQSSDAMLTTFSFPPLLFSFLLEIHAWPSKFANQPFKLFFFWFHPFFSIFLIDFSNLILFSISSSFKFLICQIRFLFFWFFYLWYLLFYSIFQFHPPSFFLFFSYSMLFFFQFNSSILNWLRIELLN
jgi:hypothetical protein